MAAVAVTREDRMPGVRVDGRPVITGRRRELRGGGALGVGLGAIGADQPEHSVGLRFWKCFTIFGTSYPLQDQRRTDVHRAKNNAPGVRRGLTEGGFVGHAIGCGNLVAPLERHKMGNPFAPASRVAGRLRIGVQGPSGSGKTLGALILARTIIGPNGRLAVIDTENESASLYADDPRVGGFDALNISPPYHTDKFRDAVAAAVANRYDAVVIDSISHQWDGEGGILQRKEEVDARGGNHFSNWAPFTKEHNTFRALLLQCPIHLIATMRSKQAYQVEENGKKSTPKKMGLQPIQREGLEYEFTITFDVQMDHKAAASKDRTGLFEGQLTDLSTPEAGKRLLAWLSTGVPLPPAPTQEQRDALLELSRDPVWTDSQRSSLLRRGGSAASVEAMDELLTAATAARDDLRKAQVVLGDPAAPAPDPVPTDAPAAQASTPSPLATLPGSPTSWGGYGGKPIHEVNTSTLRGFLEWATADEKRQKRYALQIDVAELVLDERLQSATPQDGAGE